jgi:transcriptional regulator with XRE-family HTH domain
MEKNLLIDFGNRLKKLRKEKGLTQQNMADMMGITMRNYQRYEYGDINVPATTLNFFANYFGVTTDYLLGREQ